MPVRSGGFGGVAGLADYLQREHIAALIDATHPYAEIISANAVAAARAAAVPLIALRRPAWRQVPDDKWRDVGDVAEAIEALGEKPRRVLVTVGRNGLMPLTAAPRHYYVIRSVDPVEPPLDLPQADYITARGPFSAAADRALMAAQRIDAVIAKNSGGAAPYGKIEAARALGIEVMMLRRPPPDVPGAESVEAAIAWLDHALTSAVTARGV